MNDYQSIIDNIQNDEWAYVQPLMFARRLNRILRKPEVQKAYHDASMAIAAVKRWDSFRFLEYKKVPRPFTPAEGRTSLRPIDCDTCDWRWDMPPGRPPLFHDFVMHGACHWMSVPNQLVAQQLFPDYDWHIVSSPRHTSVVCFEERLIFDLYYVANSVDVSDCLELLFDQDDYEVYEDDEYSYLDGTAAPALQLFKMLDSHKGDTEELLAGLRATMAHNTDDEDEGIGTATIATHLMTADRLIAA